MTDPRIAALAEALMGRLNYVHPSLAVNDAAAIVARLLPVEEPEAPQPDSLDDAWAEAEAALPEGWRLDGVSLAGIAPSQIKAGWQAAAIGKWSRSSRSRPVEYGYGPTPAAALRDLAAATTADTAPIRDAVEGELG